MKKEIRLRRCMGVTVDIDGDDIVITYDDSVLPRDLLSTPAKISGLDDDCWLRVTKNNTLALKRINW